MAPSAGRDAREPNLPGADAVGVDAPVASRAMLVSPAVAPGPSAPAPLTGPTDDGGGSRNRRRGRRDAGIYIAGTVFHRGSVFLVLPLLLQRLSVAEYGTFGLMQSLLNLLPALLTLNLPAAVTRLYFDGSTAAARQGIAARLTLMSLVIGATAGILVLVTVLLVPERVAGALGLDRADVTFAATYLVIGSLGAAQLQVAYAIWRAEHRPLLAAGANVVNGLLFLALGASLALTDALTAVNVVGVYALAAIVVGGGASVLAPAWRSLAFGRDMRRLGRDALHYGLPILPYILGLWALGAGGRWIAHASMDLDAVGQFTLASQLATMVGLLGRAAYEAWAPSSYALFAAGRPDEARAYLRTQGGRTLALALACGVTGAVLLAVIVPRFVPQYDIVVRLFPVMLLAPLLDIAHLRPHTELLGLKRTRPIGIYTTASVILFALLGWVATRNFGLWGLAVAYVSAHAFQYIAATLVARRPVVADERTPRHRG